jgi:DNA-binding NarL/FixJ family response regulator
MTVAVRRERRPMTIVEPQQALLGIVLIGRHTAMYDGLVGLLRQYGVSVDETWATFAEYQSSDSELRVAPDALVLDFDTLEPNRRDELLARARLGTPTTRLILLCAEATDEALRAAVTCRADGVLLESYSPADLCAAIEHVVAGQVVMPAGWRRTAVPDPEWLEALSPRHRDVLGLLAEGLRNDEIATHLGLSPNTVKFHVRELYVRIGVRNRVEASQLHASVTAPLES